MEGKKNEYFVSRSSKASIWKDISGRGKSEKNLFDSDYTHAISKTHCVSPIDRDFFSLRGGEKNKQKENNAKELVWSVQGCCRLLFFSLSDFCFFFFSFLFCFCFRFSFLRFDRPTAIFSVHSPQSDLSLSLKSHVAFPFSSFHWAQTANSFIHSSQLIHSSACERRGEEGRAEVFILCLERGSLSLFFYHIPRQGITDGFATTRIIA